MSNIEQVYNFSLTVNWKLIKMLSQIDRFDAEWSAMERTEGDNLKELKTIATVNSVGASTRIEGSKMSNKEVDMLLKNLSIDKLVDRDSQEVAGYFAVMDEISESYEHIVISENELKGLHNKLLKHSAKDGWHKGNYKQHSNNVEAHLPDGSSQIVFKTTPQGVETDDAMRNMIDWYINDNETHPIVKCALFSYEFVSIHPFQDGNGRMSRLLAGLLLLKHGYKWIQYISFEHEIEKRKPDYYAVLRDCQAQRPNENVNAWVEFFMDAILTIQQSLLTKLKQTGMKSGLSPKEKSVLAYISGHAGCSSGAIAKRLAIPNPTIKKLLKKLTEMGFLDKHGIGRGTIYTLR